MTVTEKIRRVITQGELTLNRDIAEVCGCSVRQVSRVRSAMRGLDSAATHRAIQDRNMAKMAQEISELRRMVLRDRRDRRERSAGHRPRLAVVEKSG